MSEYTGIDLPGEGETSGLLYTPATMDPASLATNAFGQNFNVTMTQMAASFSSLINGGNYYEPHVVKNRFRMIMEMLQKIRIQYW